MFFSRLFAAWSIRKKLLLLLLVFFMPALGIIIQSGLGHRNSAIEEAKNKAIIVVQSLAVQQEQIAIGTEQMLSTLAQLPEVQHLDAAACNKIFRGLHERYPFYSTISAAAPDGSVFAASTPMDADSVNISDRKHIRDVLWNRDFSIGEFIVGRLSKIESLDYTYPVFDADKRLVAIVIAGFRLGEFARFKLKSHLPPGYALAILDHNGVRLYGLPQKDDFRPGTRIQEDTIARMTEGLDQGIFEGAGSDGVVRISAFRRLHVRLNSPHYMFLIVGLPKDEILYHANREMLENLLMLGMASSLAMCLAWFLGNLAFLRPINHLVAAARQLGKAQLGTRTGMPHTRDELGQLAKAFDEMASLIELRNIERMEAERELKKSYDELDAKVAERTEELARANVTLKMQIEERHRIEEELRESRQRASNIINFLPDATFVIDRAGKVIVWNRAIEEMTGIRAEDMLGKDNFEYALPLYGCRRPMLIDLLFESEEKLREHYSLVFREKDVIIAEAGGACLRDKRVLLWGKASPLYDQYGKITGAIEVIRDVTDSKAAEDALREKEAHLRLITENMVDNVCQIDERGCLIYASPSMKRIFGFDAMEILGRPVTDLIHPEDMESVLRSVCAAIKSNTATTVVEYRHGHANGAYLWVESLGHMFYDDGGKFTGAVYVTRDITRRKRAEFSLNDTQEKFRILVENIPVGISLMDRNGNFEYCNPAFTETFGYSLADIPSMQAWKEKLLAEDPGIPADFGTHTAESLLSGARVRCRNGGTKTVNIRSTMMTDGRLLFTYGDITEQVRLEAQLRQAQKMEAIGTLAGGIAHDFNNILTPIIGYCDLSLREIPEGSRLHRNIEQVLRSSTRARDMVRQILAFSRQTEHESRPVALDGLLREAITFLRSTLPSTIEIRQNIDPESADRNVIADPTQIHQVIINLCANAAHAIGDRIGILEVGLSRIDTSGGAFENVPELKEGSYLKLSISDTGHGMEEAVKQRIFDPYFTTKGPNEGTGLGLAVVYGIVKRLAGAITVSSKPGEGTTFEVLLPEAKKIPAVSARKAVAPPHGKGHILVVDDEKYIVDLQKEMLDQLGYEVTARYSSLDALDAFRSNPHRFDLILTDQTMPQMTGVELAMEALGIRPGIPIVLCTGLSENINMERAGKTGLAALLMKPMSLQDLAETIHRILNEPETVIHPADSE